MEAWPTKSTSSKDVAAVLLKKWVFCFGVPENLHSDNGTGFTSSIWKSLMEGLGLPATMTSNYSPQSNDVERHHRMHQFREDA